jgi:type 2 lantibiotic biosynthesis protein LanM
MPEAIVSSQNWIRAATLTERAYSPVYEAQCDSKSAQGRYERWYSQPPFDSDDYLQRRLALIGLREDQFLHILAEPPECLEKRVSTPWMGDVDQAFLREGASSDSLPQAIEEMIQSSFLRPLAGLMRLANQRLRRALQSLAQQHPHTPFEPSKLAELLLPSLGRQLLQISTRTFVLELNIARIEERLTGQTSEERYESFLQLISSHDETLRLLSEYPVLTRQLVHTAENWVNASVEFASRLSHDWPAIKDQFCDGGDPGTLQDIQLSVGDMHRGGRSVHILRFSEGFRIVYKPRSLSVDVHFQELLGWLNDCGVLPKLPRIRVMDRRNHGWQEFAAAATCASREEVERFYAREGAYLALLYLLAGTDFHYENLVAAGENPILVDLEAVFHPRLFHVDLSEAENLAANEMQMSVVATGLLPHRIGADENSDGLDISGMGAWGGQVSPWRAAAIEDPGTDHMCFARKHFPIAESVNRPTLAGKEVHVLEYQEALLAGFTATYRLLLKHREELLSKDGPLFRLSHDEVRVILRPTRVYGQLLFESYHPDVLGDALDRDQLLDRLWAAVPSAPHIEQVIAGEHKDLLNGDIPIFTTRPDSRDLWHAGHDRVRDFFGEPPISGHRAAQLSEEDLARQLWFVRASLTTLSGAKRVLRREKTNPVSHTQPIGREDLVRAAAACGDRLVSLAYQGQGDASWLSLGYIEERQPRLVPVAIDLYEGLSGITLFLAHLGAITGERRYSDLARAAMSTVKRKIGDKRPALTSLGGFAGWGGVIYALSQLANLWDDSEPLEQAEAVVDLIPALIEDDTDLDLISGSAGCISGLLALYSVRHSERVLATAIRCAEWLLTRSQPVQKGIAWPSAAGTEPLTGVSHGASGYAFALSSLFQVTQEPRFRTAALQAIEFERSYFCDEVGNWLDLRRPRVSDPKDTRAKNNTFCVAWCHGAPGIGLMRLKLLPFLEYDSLAHKEIRTALNTTILKGFEGDHSLCHGDFGNLEFLLQASQSLPETRWQRELSRLTAATLDSIQRRGWICGLPQGIEVPGLMTGLAGIGYELLRLAEPSLVPSVLTLEPRNLSRPGQQPALVLNDPVLTKPELRSLGGNGLD